MLILNIPMVNVNLSKVVGSASSLPHSNAYVERIFSQLKLIKTDIRNPLKEQTLVSVLHSLKAKGIASEKLEVGSNLLVDSLIIIT